MAKRKKYPKLPNGFGSIRYLGRGRRNAYAVHPPVTEFDENGVAVRTKPLCYVNDWMEGFAVLTAYKAGTWQPEASPVDEGGDIVAKILADYNRSKGITPAHRPTFAEVYADFFADKFDRDKSRTYSKSLVRNTKFAFKHCAAVHNRPIEGLRLSDLQAIIDDSGLRHAGREMVVSVVKQVYKYALLHDIVPKDYAAGLRTGMVCDDEHGVAITDADLATLWQHRTEPDVAMVLVMCYTGFRVSAYGKAEINIAEGYIRGGVKTKAGKDRIVPVHSMVRPLLAASYPSAGVITKRFHQATERLGLPHYTPHDCRHTFSALTERAGIPEADRKRLLGHSFGNDLTNGIYGHRTVDELRQQIEKIEVVTNL